MTEGNSNSPSDKDKNGKSTSREETNGLEEKGNSIDFGVKAGQYDLDVDYKRESTRSYFALSLLGLFFLEITLTFIFVATGWWTVDNAKDILGIVISPTVGLLGAATGFYYANEQN